MKNSFAAAMFAAVSALIAAQALLWERVKKLEQAPKSEKPEENRSGAAPDYWEKLWAKGLEGIMSYGVADARGERQDGE